MKAANHPIRDEREVDDCLRRLEKIRAAIRARNEEERIRRHNEQLIPATLKRQAG